MSNHFLKTDLKNGFYQIPNSIMKYRKELNLTLEDIGIINYIAYQSKGWAINFKEELSDMSESTVRRKIKNLKDKGYLTTTSKKYKTANGFGCVGSICDIEGLISKIHELDEIYQKEGKSKLTEITAETVKNDTYNNTNINNTNSVVSIFVNSLRERNLTIPKEIGENKLNSLNEKEQNYLKFAGEYIENETREDKWKYKGTLMSNSLNVLLNPNRKSHFFQFCEQRLQEEEFMEMVEENSKELELRVIKTTNEKWETIQFKVQEKNLTLIELKESFEKDKVFRSILRCDKELLQKFPPEKIEKKHIKFISELYRLIVKNKVLEQDENSRAVS